MLGDGQEDDGGEQSAAVIEDGIERELNPSVRAGNCCHELVE